jgi:hypothetical protein
MLPRPQRAPRLRRATPWCALAMLLVDAAAGCALPADTGGPEGCESCALEDQHASSLGLGLSVESTPLSSGEDALLDWSALGEDMLGRPVERCEALDLATLYLFGDASEEEVLANLARDRMGQSEVVAQWTCEPQGCGCSLADFSFLGHPLVPALDFTTERGGTWLLTLAGGEASGLRSVAFLNPSPQPGADTLPLTDDTARAELELQLAPRALEVPAGSVDYEVSWAGVNIDGWGLPLDHYRLDRARLDRLETGVAELSLELLALDVLSPDRWQAEVAGLTELPMHQLEGSAPFEGVDRDATWLFTLWCDSCAISLPRVTALLEAQE